MAEHRVIKTERLILRPFMLADAPEVQRLVSERDIAATTINIPHPYEDGIAEDWIKTHEQKFEQGESVSFAITHREQGFLIGAIGLDIEYPNGESRQLGYWIGKPYWNQGYCTEAARAVVKYGFDALHLNRIFARHFGSNPASGRVMQKTGMKYEGTMREAIKKWGRFEDMVCYAILKGEYNASPT